MAVDYILGLDDANTLLLIYSASSPPSESLSKGSGAHKSPVQHCWQKHITQMQTDVFLRQVLSTRKEVTLSCSNTDAVVRFLSPQPRKQADVFSPHHKPFGPANPFPHRAPAARAVPVLPQSRGSRSPLPGPFPAGRRKRGPAASHRPRPRPGEGELQPAPLPLLVGTNISPCRRGNSPRPGLGEGEFPSHCLPGSALPDPAASESEWPGGPRRRAPVRHPAAAGKRGSPRPAGLQSSTLRSLKKSSQYP